MAHETQGVQVKLPYPLTMRAIREHLSDVSCGSAIQIGITFTFTYLYLYFYLYLYLYLTVQNDRSNC